MNFPKNYLSVTRNSLLELIPPNTYHVFVCDSENDMDKRFGNYFLGKSHFSYMRKTQDKFDHNKGQKSAISGRRLHWRLSTGFFVFSPVLMCNLVRRAP